MLWVSLQLALREIWRNLLRSLLTVLGIVIGVAAVITMVTLGNGASRAVAQQIQSLGSNLLVLRPGQRLGPMVGGTAAPNFRIADLQAIVDEIADIDAVAPVATRRLVAISGARTWATTVTGSSEAYPRVGNWSMAEGRYFTDSEARGGAAVCVLGQTVSRELFRGDSPVGSHIRLGSFSCEVSGVFTAKGQSSIGSDQDDTIVIPLRTLQIRLTGSQDINAFLISVREGSATGSVATQVRTLMRERRRLGVTDEDNFSLLDTRQIADTLASTTRLLADLLGAVAAVSLLVGGIGIMNIMLVSVTERIREIGIRLAIGALEREVLTQFLVEAVVLSAFGGLGGVLLAALASYVLAGTLGVPFLFDLPLNLLGFGFAAVIGVLFGYLPARRAARLDPIEALRHE